MKSAEDLLNETWVRYNDAITDTELQLYLSDNEMELIHNVINKARKEAIEECARVATVIPIGNNYSALAQQGCNRDAPYFLQNQQPEYLVDKQSILKLINELK
jgi:hypothetical protein